MYSFSCSTVRYFVLNNAPHIYKGRPGLLYCEPRCCNTVQIVAWHRLTEITGLKKTLLGWQHMLLQNQYVPFSINGTFTDVQVIYALVANTPQYHHRCWLLNFALITIWMVLFLFGLEDMR
ncbi:hypothetical protein AMECASPLE_035734 [Ameca splendens]|uniref:Uncharacterized protein n=1 Tax=Ameca splendens TaxID=208324 RepID=A0ABV0YV62_9TELE